MTAARHRTLPALAGLVLLLGMPQRASAQGVGPPKHVYLFNVPGVSFERLLDLPEARALARSGGTALMSYGGAIPRHLPPYPQPIPGDGPITEWDLDPARLGGLRAVGGLIRDVVLGSPAPEVLVVVLSTVGSEAMAAARDELHPIVVAHGAPTDLFPATGSPRTLTSGSTRRVGVVIDGDVWPTIADYLGGPVPRDLEGSVVRPVDEPPPFELHERYLDMRRMTVPVQSAAGFFVLLGGLFGVALLVLRRRVPTRVARVGAWVALSVPALSVALLAAGHLPALSYATVVPFAIVATVAGTAAFAPLARRDVLLAPVAIGAAVLAYFVVEASLGWAAAQTPFLGGSELDGGRFYGLPNVFIGLLIGASLYVVSRLRPVAGFALVVAVALFAGLPFAGANLGAAISLFAAAGLWLPLRARGRLGWRELGMAAAVVVAGTAVVLLAHRFFTDTPTHVTRFEEGAGLGEAWSTFTHRLAVGWRLIERNPFAIVPVVGLPATLVAVLRPPASVGEALARHSEWRDALLVTLLAGLVAYVANDTGAAASGLAFGLGLGGLVYVSLIEGTWKMEGA